MRELFDRASDAQREELLDLVHRLRQLRRQILEDHNVVALEPLLASPRSSLNPKHFSSGHCMDLDTSDGAPKKVHSDEERKKRNERRRARLRRKQHGQ